MIPRIETQRLLLREWQQSDFATLAQDEHTVLATDTIDHLWHAFRTRVEDEDGVTWIAGLAARSGVGSHDA